MISTRRNSLVLMPGESDAERPIVNTNKKAPSAPLQRPCIGPAYISGERGGPVAGKKAPRDRVHGPGAAPPVQGRHGPAAPGKYFVDTPSRLRDLVKFPQSNPPTYLTTMAHSEVLLVKPVDGLGGEGDQVKVRAGYARNFLLPSGMALPVTNANRKQVEALKKRRAEREAHELSGAQELAKKLEKTSLAFAVMTGEGGKMFGAITAGDLYDKLVGAGIAIDRK